MLSTVMQSKPLNVLMFTIFFLLIYQTLHMIDHVLQYMQTYVMGISDPPALFEGVLRASDTTIHFWLNIIEWSAIAVLWVAFRESQVKQNIVVDTNSRTTRSLKILMGSIFFLVIFQTFHVIDHVLQYVQLYMIQYTISVGAPGLFQGLFSETDRIIHTWVNGALILAVIVVWAAFRSCQVQRIISRVSGRGSGR